MKLLASCGEVTIKALMVDVDGVLVNGRPEDGEHWSASLEEDLGLSADVLQQEYFCSHWNDIVLGRVALMDRLPSVSSKDRAAFSGGGVCSVLVSP